MSFRRHYKIRTIEERDLAIVLKWRNSERIRRVMFSDHIITLNEHHAWFSRLSQQDSVHLVFEYQKSPWGLVCLTDIDNRNNKCDWGFYLGELNLPKNSGLIMGVLGLEYIFEKKNIRKLCSQTFAFNTSGVNFHQRLGFVKEGLLKKHVLKNGNYEDVISFALFADEWHQNRDKLEKSLNYKVL
jgi:UDP-4-amino-4,6-dideoxy-N-acetyl-beta-L-altrosamine N-acetyltransferase